MKILFVNSFDYEGGAARSAYRLLNTINNNGISSKLIVQKKFLNDKSILLCKDNWNGQSPFYDRMPLIKYPDKDSTLFSVATIPNESLINFINDSDFDIIHLHWISNGFLSIEDISKINKPIVWTIHDNWAFTGGCHIMWECEKYKIECGSCPRLRSNIENDLSKEIFNLKKKAYLNKNDMVIVAPSKWLYNCSKKSKLLKNKKHVNIANPLETNLFKPLNKELARKILNLPENKKLVLFGAMHALNDINKGFKQLKEALEKLSITDNIEFIVFGSNEPSKPNEFAFKTHYLGQINDDQLLITLYSSADVMIVPSLQENLSNAIIESLSCGTPVVAFDVGGNSDIIDHKINGYLANPFDTTDLRNGIEWVLLCDNYNSLCINARNKIKKKFNPPLIAKKYKKLYSSILKQSNENNILSYRPNYKMKFISKEIEHWFFKLSAKNFTYVIYGYGSFGAAMLDYFPEKIVAFIDQKSSIVSKDIKKHEIYSPQNIVNMIYDRIIISVLGRENEIENYLVNTIHINKEKIIRFVL